MITSLHDLRRLVPRRAWWAVADDRLLDGWLHNEPVERGTQGTMLHHWMNWVGGLGLTAPLVALIGGWRLANMVAHRRARIIPAADHGPQLRVFVGFGARAESSLREAYFSSESTPCLVVDETAPEQAAGPGPNLRAIVRLWFSAARDVHQMLSVLPRVRRAEAAVSAAKHVASYVYARAWWRGLASSPGVQEAAFVATGPWAFAAIAEGIPSRYVQHGLLWSSTLLAPFSILQPLTEFEGRYMADQVPSAGIMAPRWLPRGPQPARAQRLLIVSGQRPLEQMRLIVPLIKALTSRGWTAHVRLFSGESPERFWESIRREAAFEYLDSTAPFNDILTELNPAFVASWNSTALVEALFAGLVPIIVAPLGDRAVAEPVFPLASACLHWPTDGPTVLNAIADPEAYNRVVERLQSVVSSDQPTARDER